MVEMRLFLFMITAVSAGSLELQRAKRAKTRPKSQKKEDVGRVASQFARGSSGSSVLGILLLTGCPCF